MKLFKAIILAATLALPTASFAAPKKIKMDAGQAIQDLMSKIIVGDSSDENCSYDHQYDAATGELLVFIKQGSNEVSVKMSPTDKGLYTYVEKDKDGYGTMTYITPNKSEVEIFQAEDAFEGMRIKTFDSLGRAQELKCAVYF